VIGSAIALQLLFGLPLIWGVVLTSLDVLLILLLQQKGFRRLEAFIIALIVTIGVCFGAEMVLHGHAHVHALNWLEGPSGPIPALGVPSASAAVADGKAIDCAAYNLYRIGGTARAYSCEAVTRGFGADAGRIVELGRSEVKLAAQV